MSGADLVAFQRLVRRVPVAEPVMRYALDARAREPAEVARRARRRQEVGGVRRQRPRRAVPGARRQGARADQRPLSRELRGHPRAGAPGAAPPRARRTSTPVGRRHERLDGRPAARSRADAAGRGCRQLGRVNASKTASTSSMPGARFVDPKVLARIGNLELLARTVVDGFINGLHRSPYFGASVDFAEHRGYVPGDDIRRVDWKLYARTDRYYLKEYEADTNANFSVLLDVSRSMAFGSRGITKLDYGKYPRARAWPTSRTTSATASASSRSTATSSTHVPPSAKHLDVVLHTLDRAKPERPGQPGGAAAEAGRALRPPRHPRGDLGLLRGARGDLRRGRAAAVPRQRHHRLPRARPGGDRVHVHRAVELRGPRERRADAGRARGARRRSTASSSRSTSTALTHASSREQRVDYMLLNTATPLDYALFRYLSMPQRLSADPVDAMAFLAPLFLLGLAALAVPVLIHLTQRERKQVVEFPSLMFLQQDSVPVGAAPAHPRLAAAGAARWRRWR